MNTQPTKEPSPVKAMILVLIAVALVVMLIATIQEISTSHDHARQELCNDHVIQQEC